MNQPATGQQSAPSGRSKRATAAPLSVHLQPRREEYAQTLEYQTKLQQEKIENPETPDSLVLVEHDHVYTVGRSVPKQIVQDKTKRAVRWIEIGRGGDATYHGPGQLVAYPILNLERHGKDVHVFLRKLEDVVILCLERFDVAAFRREGLTGVWVNNLAGEAKKICSIGVGVKKWVSYHGLALNISTDLSYFRAISPCGQEGAVMTSLAELLEEKELSCPTFETVQSHLIESFSEVFQLSLDIKKEGRPKWIRAKAPGSPAFKDTLSIVKEHKLVTVCEEAHCPNIGECWSHNTATFMIMGDLCTRRCSFCAVKDGNIKSLNPLDPLEPYRVGQAVKLLGLKHVVITSVNRDDLDDMGAKHFNQTVKAIVAQSPETAVELLIPDMRGDTTLVEEILQSGLVSILNHNIETVPRLYRTVRPGAIFERSLTILRHAKVAAPNVRTKSGLMVGLGETKEEVFAVMDSLREAGCDIMTIGQYLRPTEKQLPVKRFITPEEFAQYQEVGLQKGFLHVESGALVRSSYHAWHHAEEAGHRAKIAS